MYVFMCEPGSGLMKCPGCFSQSMLMISKFSKGDGFSHTAVHIQIHVRSGLIQKFHVFPMRWSTDTSVRGTGINGSYDWDIVKDRREG